MIGSVDSSVGSAGVLALTFGVSGVLASEIGSHVGSVSGNEMVSDSSSLLSGP